MGKAPQKRGNAFGLGPLATSIPLTGVACLPNKQAPSMSEKGKWGLDVVRPLKRSSSLQAGTFARALTVFQGRREDCVPHRGCKSVSQNLSYVTCPEHPRQLWLLARAVRGHWY